MMIRYYYIYTKLSSGPYLIHSGYPVIAGHYQVDTVLRGFLYQINVDAVSVVYSVRYAVIDPCSYG